MSYDLFLSSPNLDQERFTQYFAGRANYATPGVYVNEDTGVYFLFEYHDEAFEGAASTGHVAFNLNFYRPKVFGLEAEPELSAFVAAFDCAIHDPQMNGMDDGPYSPAGFLRGWNRGNLFGYETIGAKSEMKNAILADEARIEQVWRWNLGIEMRRLHFGADRVVPRANWGRRVSDLAPVVFAVWREGLMTVFPDFVDHILFFRSRTVSKGLFKGKQTVLESALISLDEVAAMTGCGWRDIQGGRLLLAPVEPSVASQRSGLPDGKFSRRIMVEEVSTDHVLDAALMGQAKLAAG